MLCFLSTFGNVYVEWTVFFLDSSLFNSQKLGTILLSSQSFTPPLNEQSIESSLKLITKIDEPKDYNREVFIFSGTAMG